MLKFTALRYKILGILLAGCAALCSAADFNVTAALDSASILIGYTTRLKLSVEQPSASIIHFPLLSDKRGMKYISVCNDSVEISTDYSTDTVKLGKNRILVNYNLTVQSFDSGFYKLPEFEFVSGTQVGKSNSVFLKVNSLKLDENAEISGFTGVEEPDPLSDKLKDPASPFEKWIKKYWWVVLLIVLLVVASVWAIRKYRKEGTLLPVKPIVPPYNRAMEQLSKLKEEKLWENGKEKEYYTRLTEILRTYLADEFDIPAMEMISNQIISSLRNDELLHPLSKDIRFLLDMADFAKYAKVRPLPEDNERSYSIVYAFIRDAHKAYIDRLDKETKDGDLTSTPRKGGNA